MFAENGITKAFIDSYKSEKFDGHDYIHGDAGVWNMIQNDDSLRIIDFSELRVGSCYLDRAAGFHSALEFGTLDTHAFRELYTGYSEIFVSFDKELFNGFLELWELRGIVALVSDRTDIPDSTIKMLIQNFVRLRELLNDL